YNDLSTTATLHAYDANNLANELWNSDMNGRDKMGAITKFVGPTVANGRVYAPTYENAVIVYGLLADNIVAPDPPAIRAVASAANYASDVLSPGEIVAIFGTGLGPSTPVGLQLDGAGMVSTSIGGAQVLFDGIPGPMVWASQGQVNAVVPFGIINQTTQVQVQYQDHVSDSLNMAVAP